MKRKPIRIDWDQLEEAFDNKNTDLVYYLDRITGHVLLEGEGENGAYDDDEQYSTAAPPTDSTRAYVRNFTDDQKLEWVRRFVNDTPDLASDFAKALRDALAAPDPVPATLDALNQHPDGKEIWYAYRTDRLHSEIEKWLTDNSIAVTAPPPWK